MKKLAKTPAELEAEQEKLTEILIVLEDMFQREQATGRRIIGCLYDIATVNWINARVPLWPLNPCLKGIAKLPKPLAQDLAVKWFLQPKCPKLITQWLSTLVVFPSKTSSPGLTLANPDREIRKLQQQVRLLSSSLVLTILCATSGIAWFVHQDYSSTVGVSLSNLHQAKKSLPVKGREK